MMTDEQYIDALFAKEPCSYQDTPGFRDFLLELMATIGERPRAGDVAQMHLASSGCPARIRGYACKG